MGWHEEGVPEGERASPSGPEEDWQTIFEALVAGNYRQAAALMREKQEENDNDPARANSLAAARQLCLTCHQYGKEIEVHRQSLADAIRREKALRQRILSLLSLAGGKELVDTADVPKATLGAEEDHPGPTGSPTEERPGFWQRFLDLLGLSKRPQPRSVDRASTPPAGPSPLKEPLTEGVDVPAATASPAVVPDERPLPVPDGAALTVYTLGPFRVYQAEQLVEEWPSLKGQSIFKYLIARRERPVNKEVLMDLFWPDADPESARNNLNVAIYGLRQAFRQIDPDLSYVIFRDNAYLLNPELHIWVDVEAFRQRFTRAKQLEQRGDFASATAEYHAAEALYEGDFLEEDRYEDWLLPLRRQLRKEYLEALSYLSQYYFDLEDYGACITLCRKILEVDRCREEAYQLYMRCCHRQGQRYLALRQYHRCVEALEQELEARPSQSTMELYERIRQSQSP